MKAKVIIFVFLGVLLMGVALYVFYFTRGTWDIKTSLKMRNLSKEMNYLNIDIKEAIKTEATNISQCRTIPFGNKPCGGPSLYLVYSIKNTDEEKLVYMVKTYNNLARDLNNLSALSSTCDFISESTPEFDVVSGNCVIK